MTWKDSIFRGLADIRQVKLLVGSHFYVEMASTFSIMKERVITCLMIFVSLKATSHGYKAQQTVDSLFQDSIWRSEVLDSIVVKGSKVTHQQDKDVFIITDEMREKTFNTYDLIGKLPGFFYNRITKKLSFRGKEKVCLLVDGVEKEGDYIGRLSNTRFRKIEITQNPTGRFDGYDVVVNLITRTGWQGYELNVGPSIRVAPTGEKQDIHAPFGSFTFTLPKWDWAVSYDFTLDREKRNTYMELAEAGQQEYKSIDSKDGITDNNQDKRHLAWVDADYRLSKSHIISARYAFVCQDQELKSDNLMEKRIIGQDSRSVTERNTCDNVDKQYHAFSLYYRGQLSPKWKLYTDATYSHQHDHRSFSYAEQTYTSYSCSKNSMDMQKLTLDATNNYSYKGMANFGISINNRNYYDRDTNSGEGSKYKYSHYRPYARLHYQISKNISTGVGALAEFIHTHPANGEKDNQLMWGGNANLRANTNDYNLSANLMYDYRIAHPSLVQLTTVNQRYDSLIVSSGNPMLHASGTHLLIASVNYKKFNISGTIIHSSNAIMPVYKTANGFIWHTYDNAQNSSINLHALYNNRFKLGKNTIEVNGMLTYDFSSVKYESQRQSVSGLGVRAMANWQTEKWGSLMLAYSRMPSKTVSLQTVSHTYTNDGWILFYSVPLLNNSLMLDFDFFLPIKMGVDFETWTTTETPFYTQHYDYDCYDAAKYKVGITLQYRLAKGKAVSKLKNQQSTLE